MQQDISLVSVGSLGHMEVVALSSFPEPARPGSILARTQLWGNDALIVADCATFRGFSSHVIALSPATGDEELLTRCAGRTDLTVVLWEPRPGPRTDTFCLHDREGRRLWLLPSSDVCIADIPPIPTTRWLYVDFYPELRASVRRILAVRPHPYEALLINLSTDDTCAHEAAPFHPDVVQLSCGEEAFASTREWVAHAETTRQTAGASLAVVTCGRRGVGYSTGRDAGVETPRYVLPEPAIGAGSAFSAGLMAALADGLGPGEAVGSACMQAGEIWSAWSSRAADVTSTAL